MLGNRFVAAALAVMAVSNAHGQQVAPTAAWSVPSPAPQAAAVPRQDAAAMPQVVASDIDPWVLDRLQAIETELAMLRGAGLYGDYAGQGAAAGQPLPVYGLPEQRVTPQPTPDPQYPTVKVGGLIQLDAGYYHQDAANRATLGDIDDGLGFRRVRPSISGQVTENTAYMLEMDFAQGQPRFVDVWMEFQQTPLGNLRIGRFRQPFGMSELNSIRALPFLERPLQFALAPFRQTGAMLYDTAGDGVATWAISGYRYLSDNFGNVYADDGGYGMASRVTALLVDQGEGGIIHVGADYSYNDPGRDEVQYATGNEFFVGQNPLLGPSGLSVLPLAAVPPFVNTGAMPTADTNLFNAEAGFGRGSFAAQSEARWAQVRYLDGTSDTFPGIYLHARYVLTGESIPYDRDGGVFGRIRPSSAVDLSRGCWGAWELAARGSYLDLSGTGVPGPGGHLTDSTVGLNWYVNNFTKFQFNWIHSRLDDPALDDSDAQTYALRGQIDF